jgi:hypothetical protein
MKVQELEKEILDSREKTEFYRTKMQELVSILCQVPICLTINANMYLIQPLLC